ncbi:hypothetical protein DL93DRAFT_2143537 [Clavulina sp. PMI_390]|nr:hypothetical protein DL93DRAFT_2143537 [Clavulina sp. PMI_390]
MQEELQVVVNLQFSDMAKGLFPEQYCNMGLSDITAELVAKGHLITGEGWDDFNPSTTDKTEPIYFGEKLPKLINRIRSARKDYPPTSNDKPHQFLADGLRTPEGPRNNTSRPDAYFYLAGGTVNDWDDISTPWEVKKKNAPEMKKDNGGKILWSMHHIMRSDPCRRFVLGVTLEDLSLRLWYMDQAAVMVSDAIDIVEDFEWFIKLIIALGECSPENLGWDLTIEKLPRSKLLGGSASMYQIAMHDSQGSPRIFRTCRLLSDVGAEAFIGRGTRVWAVNEVIGNKVDTSRTMILKDYWVNEDRTREATILNNIRQELLKAGLEKYLKNFLSVLIDEDVRCSTGEDITPSSFASSLPYFDLRPISEFATTQGDADPRPLAQELFSQTNKGGAMGAIPVAQHRQPHGTFAASNRVETRQHYRIVFREEGRDILHLANRRDMFLAIEGAFKALKALHSIEYVHRDISCGNVLLVGEGDKAIGVLSDLEYATNFITKSGNGPHAGRTGTAHFLACEVARHRYIFAPAKHKDSRNDEDDDNTTFQDYQTLAFQYNPLHDLESMWWLCLWCVTAFDKNPKNVVDEHKELVANTLFPGTKQGFVLRTAVLSTNQLKSDAPVFPLKHAVRVLSRWGVAIVDAYYDVMKTPHSIDRAMLKVVSRNHYSENFKKLAVMMGDETDQVTPIV